MNITSQIDHESKFLSKLSPEEDLVIGIILVVTGLISIIGNIGSLAVFYERRKQLSPAELFLVNLGIVNCALAIASYPCSMISSFHHKWLFGSTGCTYYGFICYWLGLASLISISSIAVVRYCKTCCPDIGNRITREVSLRWIIVDYLYALFWALLPLVGLGSYEVEPFGLSCTLDWWADATSNRIYLILVTLFCVFIPITAIIFCYTSIVLRVKASNSMIGESRGRHNISEAQLTWMSFIISLGFILGWMPYTVVSLWAAFTGEVLLPMWATPIPVLMAKSSIAYNPFIYTFLTKRYREDLVLLSSRMFRKMHGHGGESITLDTQMDDRTNACTRYATGGHPSHTNM